MAVGVFRKISDKLSTLWNSLKEVLPGVIHALPKIAPVVAPLLPPEVAPLLQPGVDILDKMVNGSQPKPKPSISQQLAESSSPFIKFNRTI